MILIRMYLPNTFHKILKNPKIKKCPVKVPFLIRLLTLDVKFQIENTQDNKNQISFFLGKIVSTQNSNNKMHLGARLLWQYLHENQFFASIFKNKVNYIYMNSRSIIPVALMPYMVYSAKSINWRSYKIVHSNEVVELLFVCLWLKNLNMFMKWVRKFFEKNELKKHRKFVLLLGTLLGKFIWGFNIFLKLYGLRVSIIGKFGKAGSVRKTRRYIKRGKCSYTSKKLAMVSQTKVIRTLTGVFSIKLEVFY